jgi:hypothetical protein
MKDRRLLNFLLALPNLDTICHTRVAACISMIHDLCLRLDFILAYRLCCSLAPRAPGAIALETPLTKFINADSFLILVCRTPTVFYVVGYAVAKLVFQGLNPRGHLD